MEQIAHLLNEEPKKKKIITGDPNTFISIMNKIFDGKVTVPTPNDKTDSDITFYPISKNAGTSQAFSQILSAPNEELQRRLTSQLIQELQAETNEGLMGLFGLEFKGYEISKGRSEIDKVWHTIISTLEIKDTEKFITFIQGLKNMHHKTGTIHGLATKIDMIFRDFITQFRNTYEKIQQGHMENPKQMFTSGGIDNFMETRKEIFNAIPMLKKPGILGKLEHRTPMINLGEAWKNKGIKLYKKALDAGFQADVTNTSGTITGPSFASNFIDKIETPDGFTAQIERENKTNEALNLINEIYSSIQTGGEEDQISPERRIYYMDLLLRLIEEMRIGTEDVQKKVTNTPAFGHFKPSMRNNIISRLERDQEVIRKMVPDINRWKCSVNWSKKRMLNMGDSTSTQQSDSTRI